MNLNKANSFALGATHPSAIYLPAVTPGYIKLTQQGATPLRELPANFDLADLAFWTGRDCERIRALMNKSALARDKWEREDYLPRTILGAVGRQFERGHRHKQLHLIQRKQHLKAALKSLKLEL